MVMLCKTLDKVDLPLFVSVMPKNKWVGEIKQDGDRIRMRVRDGNISLTNRRGVDVTEKYPEFTTLNVPDCFLDGEMCVMDENGVSQFNAGITFRSHCKNSNTIRTASEQYPVTYVVFDCLEFEKLDLRTHKLRERIGYLHSLNLEIKHRDIKLSKQREDIVTLWEEVVKRGEEGIVLKDLDSIYSEGKRSSSWKKVKDIKEVTLEFVKYNEHNKGITLETTNGIRVTCNGYQSQEVKEKIDDKGVVLCSIRHLGETENHKFRQPTFNKLEQKR